MFHTTTFNHSSMSQNLAHGIFSLVAQDTKYDHIIPQHVKGVHSLSIHSLAKDAIYRLNYELVQNIVWKIFSFYP